jgi:hypothetical protein
MTFTATSTTTDFSLDVDELLHTAASYAGGEPTSGEEAEKFLRELNLILIDLQSQGCPLSKRETHEFTFTEIAEPYIELPSNVYDVVGLQLYIGTTFKTKMKRIALDHYESIQPKTTPGVPSRYAIDRTKDACLLYVHPLNNSTAYTLKAVTHDKIEDITSLAQGIDISARFYPALLYGLAHKIAEHRWQVVDINRRQELKTEYLQKLADAFKEDRQKTPIRIRRQGYFSRSGKR